MNAIPVTVTELTPKQRALLELRLQNKRQDRSRSRIPRRRHDAAHLPLSFAQERLWFIQQMMPESAAYNVESPVRIRGRLDARALERALDEVERRHEALRTTFTMNAQQPVQVVAAWKRRPLPRVDLSGLPDEQREGAAEEWARQESFRPFDLVRGPVLRRLLLRLGEQDHVLLLTLHHVVADGWSMGLLVHEVVTLYLAFVRDRPPALPELEIQYADFALWQRGWLRGEVLATQLKYWKEQLAAAPVLTQLPADRPRPSTQSFEGAHLPFRLAKALTARLEDLGRRHGATLFMTLLAAFKVLIARYADHGDVVVGTPVANRTRAETEPLIGCFVNILALRSGAAGHLAFGEFLRRVRDVTLDAQAHQDLPFEKLVDELQPERNLSYTPFFQVVFSLGNAPVRPLELPELTLRPFRLDNPTSKFDWVLMMQETAEGLGGSFGYRNDLFDRSSIARAVSHYRTLLRSIVADPDASLRELPLISAAERHQLVVGWNDTDAPYCAELSIQQTFEAAVARRPEAEAVVFGGERLTYGELNARANQLAWHLRALGVRPGVSVAVVLERALEMVPALLGILKAGGAYVPLEPAFPKDRLHWILASLGTRWILTQTAQLAALAALDELPLVEHVLCVDGNATAGIDAASLRGALPALEKIHTAADLGLLGVDDPPSWTAPADLAYTIYTSGSTGTPKGVQVRHRPVINLIEWVNATLGVGPQDRLLFITSLCFDLSVYDVFGILAAGGTIRVASRAEVEDPQHLLRILCDEPITIWDSAPAALQQLAPLFPEAVQAQSPLRRVFLSGDWIPVSLPDRVRRVFPRARVISLGGATEATVWSNSYPIGEVDPRWPSIPYGRPMQNARYYALDARLDPCPIGIPGDLYIGGACLSAGYAGEPRLTADKYLPDPFSGRSDARLYRPGDRVRFQADGNLEFLGRVDHQVKIRGFRIELGEIEAALRRSPAVQEAVVLARRDGPGENRLVAYVIPRGDAPAVAELRGFLQDKLPEYMQPASFVFLDQFPVTANGKLRRDALPAPEAVTAGDCRPHIAPATPREERLAAIWSEVLGLESVSVDASFFELGGDSILAIQVIAKANQAGLGLSVRDVFRYQTVAELAALEGGAFATAPEPAAGPVPLSPIQQWFFEQDVRDAHHWNLSLLFEVREPLDPALLSRVMDRLVDHHDALRLRFDRTAEGWRQGYGRAAGAAPVHRVDVSALPEPSLRRAVTACAARVQASLDLSRGPLVRAVLLDGGPQPSRLLLVVHHLLVDGVSWRVLLDDLVTAYRQLERGVEIRLPAKTTSYGAWSRRLVEHARSDAVGSQLDAWLDLLPPTVPALPLDRESGANTMAATRTVSRVLSAEETRALVEELPAVFRSEINDVLLAALVRAFWRWTGEPSLLIDLEGHGREPIADDVDVSRTVGWMTSIYPVWLELVSESDPVATLKAVKQRLRSVPDRGLTYGLLRYLSPLPQPAEALRRSQPQVIFNYLGRLDRSGPVDSPLHLAPESKGPERSPASRRQHLLEVSGRVAGGRLDVSWSYSRELYDAATVNRLAEGFMAELRSLLEIARTGEAAAFTASDFPLADLDAGRLEQLESALAAVDGSA
jgi:amino acid adenylation domain-containing protein/non-ribosomal peptide synthase protein (TIGR01720 family)